MILASFQKVATDTYNTFTNKHVKMKTVAFLCMSLLPLPGHTRLPIALGWHTLLSQQPTVLPLSFPTGDRCLLRQPALNPRGLDKLLSTSGSSFSISPVTTGAPCPSEETALSNFLQVFHKKRNGSCNPHTVNSCHFGISQVMGNPKM